MLGGDGDDLFHGMGGKDKLDGRDGYDTIRYHNDEYYGGKKGIVADFDKGTVIDSFGKTDKFVNIEHISGTKFKDTFRGDEENNHFQGFSGKDSYDGKVQMASSARMRSIHSCCIGPVIIWKGMASTDPMSAPIRPAIRPTRAPSDAVT